MMIMERFLARKICAIWMPRTFSCSRNVSRFHDYVRVKIPQQASHQQTSGLLHRNLQKISPIIIRGFQERMPKEKSIMTWKKVALLIAVCGSMYGAVEYYEKGRYKDKLRAMFGTAGSPSIGGSWSLTDHNGVDRTDKDFLGNWLIIYFGFTHCPDVCPDEMEKMAKVAKHFNSKPDGAKVRPLFVTVDPERDTKEVMKNYCKEFSPEFVALTGTAEQLEDIYKKFHIFFYQNEKDKTGDYLIDHTLMAFLISPKGVYADHFTLKTTADTMIKNISLRMGQGSSS